MSYILIPKILEFVYLLQFFQDLIFSELCLEITSQVNIKLFFYIIFCK